MSVSVSWIKHGLTLKAWWFPILLCAGLIPVWLYSPLLFHSLAEFFSITVAVVILVVAWNTFVLSHNHYLMWLGMGYFSVAMLDAAHTLTFKGMPFVGLLDSNTTLEFWILARFLEAVVLILAPFYIRPFIGRNTAMGLLLLIVALLSVLVKFDVYPVMFDNSTGLTPAKVWSEWIIISLLVVAMIFNYRAHEQLDHRTLTLITVSIIFTILAELTFTLYTNFYEFTIIIGHLFKLASFWAIYLALIESCLKEPFKALSRGANTYDAIPEEISLVDRAGQVRQVNKAICNALSMKPEECIGMSSHTLQHDPDILESDCEICDALARGQLLDDHRFRHMDDDKWYQVSLSPITFGDHQAGMVHVRRDITAAKVASDRLDALNRLYTVQTHCNKAVITAESQDELFQAICDIAVEKGGFLLAWMGLVGDLVVAPSCSAGKDDNYLNLMSMRIDDSDLGNGPVGRAAKTGMVHYVNDTSTDSTFAPWREAALKRGYQAVAAVPFKRNGVVYGVFTIYSSVSEVFDQPMVELLDSLSLDLSFAIKSMDKEQRRLEAEKKLHSLSQAVEQSSNAIIITNLDSEIGYVNRSFTDLTGYTADEVIGKTPHILRSDHTTEETIKEIKENLNRGDEWHGKIQNRRKDGSLYWSQQTLFCVRDESGEITQYVSTSEDHTELHEAQETIKQLAFFDPLTQLPNRRLLADRFEQEFSRIDRHKETVLAVMLLDLDNFKTVNDSLGHNVGDSLLKHVAKELEHCVRKEDTVARLGGDEFAILMGGATVNRVTNVADNIVNKLSEPIELEGHVVQIGASVGIAMCPQDANNSDDLLRNADLAMYHAKSQGKNHFQFYRSDLNTKAHDRLVLENRIRRAIEDEHFQLYYQPQIDLTTGAIIGLEALIRWIDPDHGVISPADFIPLAEDTGMIGRIGDWVIDTACEEVSALHQKGLPDVKVAVNVSAHQFRDGQHLCDVIQIALRKHQLDANYLSLELTESILIEDIQGTIKSLNDLKGLNLTLAVDDFGTGYSSLSYLKSFPIDVLKIDQTFIRDILVDNSDKAIVTAIIAMAKQLELNVLAEGVETEAHNNFLKDFGCDYAQGYFYCKPLPMSELIAKYC